MPRMNADIQTWLAGQNPLRLVPLIDPVIESAGYQPRSLYAETYWLPVIGPASLWALRRLAAWVDAEPDGVDVPLADLAHELGLGGGTGRNAPVVRTLARLVFFELAKIDESRNGLAVLRMVPPLARRHMFRLPDHLATRHAADVEIERTRPRLPANHAGTNGVAMLAVQR